MIADLADFGVPVLLFSGGEPLLRKDVFELVRFASELGVKCVISTNGTLITKGIAKRMRESGLSYAGISLDGVGETNDRFRGIHGAYDLAVKGIRNCTAEGIKTGIRFTITRETSNDLPRILQFAKDAKVQRLCLYHLVYVGRGSDMKGDDLKPQEKRDLIDYVLDMTRNMQVSNEGMEILTVDNHADAVYIYLKLKAEGSKLAFHTLDLLKLNGGNSSGKGIACVDSNGFVHPDQFWWHYSLGNIMERRFSQIWTDESEPMLAALRNRKGFLKGRCAKCKFLDICNGNLRVRAEAVYGDPWAPDPACYLTDQEIGVA